MRARVITLFLLLLVQVHVSIFASAKTDLFSDPESLLPPVQDWSGKSELLMVETDDPWITPAELRGLSATPAYDETMAWLRKLVKAAPELEMISIGKSLQGRDFWMVIASADQAFTASALRDSGKPLLLAESLALLATEQSSLRRATREDQQRRPQSIPLGFQRNENMTPVNEPFKGIHSERFQGEVSGAEVVRWTGQPVTESIPRIYITEPSTVVKIPTAYVIPAAWSDIAQRIALHGIEVEQLSEPLTTQAEVYRLPDAGIAEPSGWTPNPFEGHIRIDPGEPVKQSIETIFPTGSFLISTDQPLGELLVLMLEPQAPDSFLQWGFFLEIFTRTEYAEAYVMEPLAQKMLKNDAELKKRFEQKLASDKIFATSQRQRLMWFYEQTPFYDEAYLLYPVARIPRTD